MRITRSARLLLFAAMLLPATPALAGEGGGVASLGAWISDTLSGSVAGGRWWMALLLAWIGGLLTALTPCVWPVIALTLRYFGGMQRGDGRVARGRVLRLAISYVGGMVVLYTTLGVAFASSGKLFGSLLANRWVLAGFALFSLAMAVSMLGAFTLRLPASWNTRLSQVGGRSMPGAAAMGLTSGIIAAPCTGPALAVILAFVASAGAISIGFWMMLAFALGLGAPFLIMAVTAGNLPSGGSWMEAVKTVLATFMAVVAVYFLKLALPQVSALIEAVPLGSLAGVVVITAGLGVLGLMVWMQGGRHDALRQAAATVLLTAGVALAAFGGEITAAPGDTGVPRMAWASEHDSALARARLEKRPVIIDFTADWCTACKELERETFSDADVRAEATRFVLVRIDATSMDGGTDALLERYKVPGLPAVLFIDSSGRVLDTPRVTSFVPPAPFLQMMKRVH